MKTALFIGRFQPFHLGHLKVIKWILEIYDKIIIVIGSSQESNTDKNPFTAEERKEMINNTLKVENIENYEIIGIPDVNDDDTWVKTVLEKASFETVFSMNPWVDRCFKKFNIRVEGHLKFGDISASKIRELMNEGKEWEHLVPEEVVKIVKRHNS